MRILLVEDNHFMQRALLRLIGSVDSQAITDIVDTAPTAIEQLAQFTYDYVLSDFDLRIGTGGDVLHHIRQHFAFYLQQNRFILMSGDLRPAITALDHPLTFEKPIAASAFRTLLTGGLEPARGSEDDRA